MDGGVGLGVQERRPEPSESRLATIARVPTGSQSAGMFSSPPPQSSCELPVPPLGWFEYGCAVLSDGSLALVRVDVDMASKSDQETRSVWPNARLRLSRLRNHVEIDVAEVPASVSPIVDCFPDGQWIVIEPRASAKAQNARLFGADGSPKGAFAIGDAVLHTSCTPEGVLWVGYFDEHVDGPVIATFDAAGRQTWAFSDDHYDPCDVYAFGTTGEVGWACTYANFPILSISDGIVRSWENHFSGARAITATDDFVLLAGGYGQESDRVVLLRLGEQVAVPFAEFRWPLIADPQAYVSGRDGVLHVVTEGRWAKLAIREWVASVG